MKKLFIIRHAKSDQSFFGNDFDRPLNERGKSDASLMAKRLMEKKISIDAFISSPAKRAKKTAEYFNDAFGKAKDEVVLISALYHASAEVFYEVISALPDTLNSIAIFSHNPGITHFVNRMHTKTQIGNMPTCGVFAVESLIARWSDFDKTDKTLLFFDFPKK